MTETREQQCRARVRGEEMVSDFVFCNLWKPYLTRDEAMASSWPNGMPRYHRWPCSSPRRNQCRPGNADGIEWWRRYREPVLWIRDSCQLPF